MTRIAIIGLGAVTRNIHLPAYARLASRLSVVGGCDPDGEARARAKRAGVSEVFGDASELIERTRPDVVSVCTPPALHRPHVELALSAGCHVFCEKPVAPTLEEADAIIGAAERAGRRVVVNSQFPYMPIHMAARNHIGHAEFGRLRYAHAWHTMRPTDVTEAGWRGTMRQRVGLDFAIHAFEIMRSLFGATPSHVLAHMPTPDPAVPWDAVTLVGMDFADGRAASMMLDRLSKGPDRYLDLRLDGEVGTIHTSIGGQLRVSAGLHTRERRPFLDVRVAGGGRAVLQHGSRSRTIATQGMNPFASATATHLAGFLDALASGAPAAGEAADHRATLALVLAAYQSAAAGRRVAVADVAPPAHREPV